MRIGLALAVTLTSAFALNLGYLIEHDAARRLPPISLRAPIRSARRLVGSRRWLLGFASEATGWMLFVLALSLAPLSLVQATAAGGIAILALMVAHVTKAPLTRLERLGVAISVTGLVLLGLSLAGGHSEGTGASYASIAGWIGASFAAAFLAVKLLARRIGDGPAYGIATGLLFASGDVATKGAVEAGGHLGFVAGLVLAYSLGSVVLQAGFQRSSALTTAGIATLCTNALPIIAGMTIFGEPLPSGWLGAVRIAAFSAVVIGAVFLGDRKHGRSPEGAPLTGPQPAHAPDHNLSIEGGTT